MITYWIIFIGYHEYVLPIYHYLGSYMTILENLLRIVSVIVVIVMTQLCGGLLE